MKATRAAGQRGGRAVGQITYCKLGRQNSFLRGARRALSWERKAHSGGGASRADESAATPLNAGGCGRSDGEAAPTLGATLGTTLASTL
eukprot:4963353-Prymnesium_polylepis.1